MSVSDEIGKLGELHQRGFLTDEEFARAKARLLSGSALGACPPPVAGPTGHAALHALRRTPHDRWVGGVCGGLGQFTDVPSWIWRVLFVLCVIFAGTGVLVYLVLWIFVPLEPVAPIYVEQPHHI